MIESIFSRRHFVSAGDTDAEGRLALPRLTSAIIDIATAHANYLGIGNPSMSGCGWVLSRLAIEMEAYPMVNAEFTLSTWVETWNRYFSERCFRIDDADGNPVGYARSIWMVLSTSSRESIGLDHLSLPEGILAPCECPIPRQGKHIPLFLKDYDGDLPRGARVATSAPATHTFRYADLDFYRHVNTVKYIDLLLDQFSLEEMDKSSVRRLELSFMKEIRYKQKIQILRADESSTSLFSFSDFETHDPLLFACIERCSV